MKDRDNKSGVFVVFVSLIYSLFTMFTFHE